VINTAKLVHAIIQSTQLLIFQPSTHLLFALTFADVAVEMPIGDLAFGAAYNLLPRFVSVPIDGVGPQR